jgi:hypothetical protein
VGHKAQGLQGLVGEGPAHAQTDPMWQARVASIAVSVDSCVPPTLALQLLLLPCQGNAAGLEQENSLLFIHTTPLHMAARLAERQVPWQTTAGTWRCKHKGRELPALLWLSCLADSLGERAPLCYSMC